MAKDPDEMRNLVNDPSYLDAKITLRKALYEQLANREGKHVIPYTQRLSIGSVRRNAEGTGAAPFPQEWLVAPNRFDRFEDILPDSPAKEKAREAGKALIPSPPLAEAMKQQATGK